MPIFKAYKINKCKEVMTISDTGSTPHTLESWGPYERKLSTDPNAPPIYESDRFYFDTIQIYDENFKRLFRIPVLLGQLVEMTMDSGNLTAGQIDNMTSVDFDQMVSNGAIKITEKILGWVQISKARVSFFYQQCFSGDLNSVLVGNDEFLRVEPTVEYYYDFRDFKFGEFFVQGSSPADTNPEYSIYPDQSLSPISPIPFSLFQQNQGLSLFGPGFSNTIDLPSYMRMFVNSSITLGQGVLVNRRGESRPIGGTWPLNGNTVTQAALLDTTNIYSRSTNEILLEQPPGTGLWYGTHTADPNQPIFYNDGTFAELRDIIPDGFKLLPYPDIDLSKTIGDCRKTDTILIGGGTTTPVTPPDIVDVGDIDEFSYIASNNKEQIPPVDDRFEPAKPSGLPDARHDFDHVNPNFGSDPYSVFTIGSLGRTTYQGKGFLQGWKDPREPVGDNLDFPMGTVHVSVNNKNKNLVFKPALLEETIESPIPSEIGPVRKSLADIYRRNVIRMYSLYDTEYVDPNIGSIYENKVLLHVIGYDSNGNAHFTDSKTFREKLIFTSYNKSFENTIFLTLRDLQKLDTTPMYFGFFTKTLDFFLKDLGKEQFDRSLNVKIPITFGSKSGKYQYSSLPETTMLLGYYEEFPIYGRGKNQKVSIKNDKNKRVQYSGNQNQLPLIPSFEKDSFGRKVFSQLSDVVSTRSVTYDFMDVLKNGVYKDDIILNQVLLQNRKPKTGESLNVSIPIVAKRSELYGPNPLQNLLYADMINWNTNLAMYSVEENISRWNPRLDYISKNFRKNVSSECQNFVLTDILKTGRISSMQNRFEDPVVVYTIDNGYWITIKDKTRISDVYFGLKEMHIKGYPWKTILNVIDSYIRDSSLRIDYNYDLSSDRPISLYKRSNKKWLLIGNYKCSDPKLAEQIEKMYNNIVLSFEKAWDFMVSSKYISPEVNFALSDGNISPEDMESPSV